jgi:hypothetical protein
MGESDDANGQTLTGWSARKKWFLGVLSGVAVAAAAAAFAVATRPPVLDPDKEKAERSAVLSFVSALQTHPVYMTVFYQRPHRFIDETWRKYNDTDTFYESAEARVSAFELGYRIGRHGDPMNLLDARMGQARVLPIDIARVGKGRNATWHVTALGPKHATPEESDLNWGDIDLYSTSTSFLPESVLNHADDMDLPGNIRTAIAAFKVDHSVSSFREATSTGRDLMLLSLETRLLPNSQDEKAAKIRPDAGLYSSDHLPSVRDLVQMIQVLLQSIQEWADTKGIDLGPESATYFDKSVHNETGSTEIH